VLRVGVDGNWSTFELAIGGPAVTVQLIPNTVLSEIWAVSNKYCKGNKSSFPFLPYLV
jgi:hypothetical protein